MSLEDLQNLVPAEGLDVAAIEREREPTPAADDDEPDEAEDPDVAAMRKRVFDDPEHAKEVEARVAARQQRAELGKNVEQQWREVQQQAERDQLKESIIQSVGGYDDDDFDDWDDDDDERASRVTPETVKAIDQLVTSGASSTELHELGEVVGHEVVGQIVEYRYQEQQAQRAAAQQHAQRQHDIELLTPATAAVVEFNRLAELNPHIDRGAAAEYMQAVDIASIPNVEEALRVAYDAWETAERLQESHNDEQIRGILLRGAIAEHPSDFLDQQTGELRRDKVARWMRPDTRDIWAEPEPGPRAKGRRWAKAAEGVMAEEAERQQVVSDQTGAALKRALKQQERYLAEGGTPHRKF